MRAIIEISNFAIDIAPGNVPPLAPAPPWLHSVTSRSSHAEKNGSQRGRVVRLEERLRRREVDALQTDRAGPLELLDRGVDVPHRQVHQADVALGLDRAGVGQPLVVDALAGLQQVEVLLDVGAAHEQRVGLERDRLAVLAVVEHHLGGDAVAVEVGHAGVHVVVAGRLEVVEAHAPVVAHLLAAERHPPLARPRPPPCASAARRRRRRTSRAGPPGSTAAGPRRGAGRCGCRTTR